MAQKKRTSLDEPPTTLSSELKEEDQKPASRQQEVEASTEEEDQEASTEEEDQEASTEVDDDDDDDEEKENHQRASSLKPASKMKEVLVINPKVKPLAPKPMEQTPKARSQPSAMPATSGSKRPHAENNMHATDPTRSKKRVTICGLAATPSDNSDKEVDDGKNSSDNSKKLFQRIWSEEDEIAILEGMEEFISKTGMDPFKQVNEFHCFVKKSLHVNASINQLKEKIRRLEKKFKTNAGKEGKNCEGPKFAKVHQRKTFELSKMIWANIEKGSSSRNTASPKKSKPKTKPVTNLPLLDSKESKNMDIDKKPDTSLALNEMIRFGKNGNLFGLNENVIKGGLELMGASKKAELEVRWNKLQVGELKLFVKRLQLIEDQAMLILEAYKSSNH